ELDAYRRELLADAALDADTVERDAREAILLQALLRDRAQRASQLASLSELAAQLTSVRHLDELLEDVAAQAKVLLRTDVAYLALAEGDAMRVRHFQGTL